MSTVQEPTVDLATVVQHLERLALELRGSDRWRIPEVSAACDSLTCAAVLLSTQQDSRNGHPPRIDLLRDALGSARSAVETTKFAAREHVGPHRPDTGDLL